MSKCGSRMPSMTWISLSRLPCSSALWPSIASPRSSAMPCTTWSGVVSATAAAANDRPSTIAASTKTERSMTGFLIGSSLGSGVGFVGGRLVGTTADEELADQVLKLQGRLGQHEFVAFGEHVRRAAGLDRNV